MNDLGDPYETECQDEELYELCRKVANLYAEQLYIFMSRKGKEFLKDNTNVKVNTMDILVNRFHGQELHLCLIYS